MSSRRIVDIEFDNINWTDYPDFVDAYISSAVWEDTLEPLTEEELNNVNEDSSFVYTNLMRYLW